MTPRPGTFNRFPTVALSSVFAVPGIYYTVDGSSPTDSPTRILYSTPIDLPAVAAGIGGDPMQIEIRTAPMATGALVSGGVCVRDPNLIVATASPASGTYGSAIGVVFGIEDPGTQIWYTVDGTEPFSSVSRAVFKDPIVLSRNGQYQFRHVAVELSASGTVLRSSIRKTASYAVAVQALTRSVRDPSIDMPFSVTDQTGTSLTTRWRAEDPYCLPPVGVDPSVPLHFPTNFPNESFFFAARSTSATPAGTASLTMALEGAYLTP